jgi:hypothetical protein
MTEYPVTTVCGSMRFFDQMLVAANEYTEKGYIVLMPFVAYIKPGEQENNPVKEMLDKMHFAKIDMSDEILVVTRNPGDMDHYIGTSTHNEIRHANNHGVKVVYYDTSG